MRLRSELRDRAARIEQLKKKYEVMMMSIAPSEDGLEHSQAYYLVKAAQDRQELQKAGDELDTKIRRGEKEIRALQNTLDMMNGRNQLYRTSLARSDPGSAEALQRDELDGQYQTTMATFKVKRREMAALQGELQAVQASTRALQQQAAQAQRSVQQTQSVAAAARKELDDQEVSCCLRCASLTVCRSASCARCGRRRGSCAATGMLPGPPPRRHRSSTSACAASRTSQRRHAAPAFASGWCDWPQVAQQIDVSIHDHPEFVPEIQMLYDRQGIVLPAPSAPRTGDGTSIFSVRGSPAGLVLTLRSPRPARARKPSAP